MPDNVPVPPPPPPPPVPPPGDEYQSAEATAFGFGSHHPALPTPPSGSGGEKDSSGWLRRKRTSRTWHLLAGTIAALAIGGSAIGVPLAVNSASLKGEVDGLEASLGESRQETAGLEDRLGEAHSVARQAEEALDTAMERALEEVRSDLAAEERHLDRRARELDARERQLERREEAVGLREAFIEENSFGDGLYQVGRDIRAGTYHTEGGSNCYWAKLNSSDTGDIRSNHFGPGPQTVEVDSPWFESDGCGTWTLA